ncbi:MAG: polyprenyl synthetase family protein [Treponemataceae bacterium]|nr:polyprenyl synthetase family protein [Treponemataceae bacterium]
MKFNFTTKIQKIEDIQDSFLDSGFSSEWKKLNFGNLPQGVKDLYLEQLLKPCKNLVSLGGKRWRPLFMVLCCELLKEDSDLAYRMTPLVEMVHTASLIHDDIEDGADKRRGQPCAHISFGLDAALNAGSWLYFTAFSAVENNIQDEKLKCTFNELLARELRRLHLGQAMDIYWHNNPRAIPSREEYRAMVRMKTGTLASLSAQAGLICAGASKEDCAWIAEIAAKIGEGFQVLDDVINITCGNKGKKRGDDIVEGKKSLPLILHLEKKAEDLDRILLNFEKASKEGIESPAIEETIAILNTSDCIPSAKKYAEKLIEDSCREIRRKYNDNEASLQIEDLFTSML